MASQQIEIVQCSLLGLVLNGGLLPPETASFHLQTCFDFRKIFLALSKNCFYLLIPLDLYEEA